MSEDCAVDKSCASCGISEIDEVKLLEKCTDCDLVRYFSDECQTNHRQEHQEACKKRVAELRDELLFKQPESSYPGDCPICCLPLSLDIEKSFMWSCCSKVVCKGCNYANDKREEEMRFQRKCLFCRREVPETDEEIDKRMMKRVEANDPAALCHMGIEKCEKGDYIGAFEYLSKAAELDSVQAHCHLSLLYNQGHGVDKDRGKEIHHLEELLSEAMPVLDIILDLTSGTISTMLREQ